MAKRVLMAATVPSMIGQFNMNNIHILLDMGYEVDVAADFTDISIWSSERVEKFKEDMGVLGIKCIQLDFSRNPVKINRDICSYKEIVKLLRERKYSFIHTHTPTASAIVRLAAHKTGTKVIYTAHGFHFYNGAPLKNWIIFYTVERWLSRYTDVLITINKEDYKRARDKFTAKKTVYIPGVGVDIEKFRPHEDERKKIRTELGISDGQTMLLSVGELNENKNHEAVIRAIQGMELVYVIVGKGKLQERLKTAAAECGVELYLTGFRNDIADFYNAADIYVLPSIREGLNVSLMEAMASGLPVLCGKIRGNVDLIDADKGGMFFKTSSLNDMKLQLKSLLSEKRNFDQYGAYNREKIKMFSSEKITEMMWELYNF